MRMYCFVDGGHLRAIAKNTGKALVNPQQLAVNIGYSNQVQGWRSIGGVNHHDYVGHPNVKIFLDRVIYYDARPDEGPSAELEDYWKAVELLPDTAIGFGVLRGRKRRQKQVDTLIAVDMLEGAFTDLYQVALLIAGDADFVPSVQAVRRKGVLVLVAAAKESLADELRQAADRVRIIDASSSAGAEFPSLTGADGKQWFENDRGIVERRGQ
jgi:uncharacterized LabA/DUF88 family protein